MARLHDLHGTDDGYFFVDSGHKGLGIDKTRLAVAKAKKPLEAEIKQLQQRQQVQVQAAASARNWLLWSGLALGVVVVAGLVLKKRKGGGA